MSGTGLRDSPTGPEPPARPAAEPPVGRVELTGLRAAALSVQEALTAVTRPGVGGTAVFVGTVRDNDADPAGPRAVTALDYSAHPDADRILAEVATEVAREVAAEAGAGPAVLLAVLHRTGSLAVGEVAIVAAAGAAHRGEAFTACRRLVDKVKTRVPIWKREHLADGSATWVGMPQALTGSGGSAGARTESPRREPAPP